MHYQIFKKKKKSIWSQGQFVSTLHGVPGSKEKFMLAEEAKEKKFLLKIFYLR